jgi:hypothetical protein
MNLYLTERDRILQDSAKPAWFKSMLLRLQGLDADDAFSLASTLFALSELRLYESAKHHESQARQADLSTDQYHRKNAQP